MAGIGGFGARLTALVQQGQSALQKIAAKAGKGEVKGDAKAAGPGGTAAKGKAKGKDLGGVRAAGTTDEFGITDEEERDRKRKRNYFLGDSGGTGEFVERDASESRSQVAHISAEFRSQVASGMVEGRSFTAGSCLVPDEPPDFDDGLDDAPPKSRRR